MPTIIFGRIRIEASRAESSWTSWKLQCRVSNAPGKVGEILYTQQAAEKLDAVDHSVREEDRQGHGSERQVSPQGIRYECWTSQFLLTMDPRDKCRK